MDRDWVQQHRIQIWMPLQSGHHEVAEDRRHDIETGIVKTGNKVHRQIDLRALLLSAQNRRHSEKYKH